MIPRITTKKVKKYTKRNNENDTLKKKIHLTQKKAVMEELRNKKYIRSIENNYINVNKYK